MPTRRRFLQNSTTALGAAALLKQVSAQAPAPAANRAYTAEKPFGASALEEVRWAAIGLGARGYGENKRLSSVLPEKNKIVAICDNWTKPINKKGETPLARMSNYLFEKTGERPDAYGEDGDENAWKKMLEREDINAVHICTPWMWHAPMAKAAMEAGKHAFVEVPMGLTIEEMWDLVDTSERTGMHCMMLENVNYGREELLLLNMVRQGLFGDVLHGEAAYIHELRSQMKQLPWGTGSWRTGHYAERNGNLYPTHGLGPIGHVMDMNRGDVATKLVSVSTPALGRPAYAKAHFEPDHQWNKIEKWNCGDLSTSLIKMASGKTIMLQWDETSPRPYSRHNYIQGTSGAFGGFPNRVAVDWKMDSIPQALKDLDIPHQTFHKWDNDLTPYYKAFEHPLQKRLGEAAKKAGGHGGMDFMMLYRVVENLLAGEPMDQDVYDGASWTAAGILSEISVANDMESVPFPDFTRGAWENREPVPIWE